MSEPLHPRLTRIFGKHAALIVRFVKFACSSLISFVVDYLLCLLFVPLIGLVPGNALARLFSASVNFTINRNVVFKGDEDLLPAIIKYVLLALFVLVLDTVFLWIFQTLIGIPLAFAKPLTEFVVYLINFPIQGRFVYKKRKK